MNFENALTLLKKGEKLRREEGATIILKNGELVINNFFLPYLPNSKDLLANDWELAE